MGVRVKIHPPMVADRPRWNPEGREFLCNVSVARFERRWSGVHAGVQRVDGIDEFFDHFHHDLCR
jgi:hypothetical protein